MDRALAVINSLVVDGIIGRYAIGGAMAAVFYAEPVSTFDLDIFVAFSPLKGSLISLSPLYEALSRKGYRFSGECVVIEGVPVQFWPAYNDLVEEALEQAVEQAYASVPTNVMRAEHLIAIALQTGRPKDRARVELLRSEAKLDLALLDDILRRHGLAYRWAEWINLRS